MALATKGLRKITVLGKHYVWRIRKKTTYMQGIGSPMTMAVELNEESEKTLLLVIFNIPRPDCWVSSKGRAITPNIVRSTIEAALQAGWKPDKKGTAFTFFYKLVEE